MLVLHQALATQIAKLNQELGGKTPKRREVFKSQVNNNVLF